MVCVPSGPTFGLSGQYGLHAACGDRVGEGPPGESTPGCKSALLAFVPTAVLIRTNFHT